MKYSPIDPQLFSSNREKVFAQMADNSIALLFAADAMPRNGDLHYQYRQSSDFFYLTGIEQEKSALLLSKSDGKCRTVLFILEADETMVIWEGKKLSFEEAKQISGISEVKFLSSFDDFLKTAMPSTDCIYLNANENLRAQSAIPTADERIGKEIREKYHLYTFKRFAPLLTAARVIKSDIEIQLMQTACNITESAFRKVMSTTAPGMKEYEVEAEIIGEFIRKGANGHAYEPIIAAGKNACYLHYNFNNDTLKDGDLLFMDFGAEYANYSADLSRAIPINGEFSKRQRAVYDAVLRVMEHAKTLLKPGTTIAQYHKEVCKAMDSELIGLGLYSKVDSLNAPKDKPRYFQYYMHGTSHFMGLDTHDVGDRNQTLEPGMVFSCEPGIYIMEEGLGIRLENDVVITENGCRDLMENIPIDPDEIEELMQQA